MGKHRTEVPNMNMFRRYLLNTACYSPEGGPTPAPSVPVVVPAVPAVAEPASFSVDYVRELRSENKGVRLKNAEIMTKLEQLEAAANAKVAAAEAKVVEATTAAEKRIVATEMKIAAKAAGILDLDFLKLIDTSTIKLDDKGDVSIPADFWEKAKTAKPTFFTPATGAEKGTTAPTGKPVVPGNVATKAAKDMTKEEYAAAKAALERG
jgi:hypothetical protein